MAPADKRYLQGRSGGHRGGGRGRGSDRGTFPRWWIAGRIPRGFLGSRRLVLLLLLLLLLLAALGSAIFEPHLRTRGAIYIRVYVCAAHGYAARSGVRLKPPRWLAAPRENQVAHLSTGEMNRATFSRPSMTRDAHKRATQNASPVRAAWGFRKAGVIANYKGIAGLARLSITNQADCSSANENAHAYRTGSLAGCR